MNSFPGFGTHWNYKAITRLFGLSILYAFSAFSAFAFLISPDGIAVIWPGSGVFLAALLLTPRTQWWAVGGMFGLLDFVAGTTIGETPMFAASIYTLITISQAIVSAALFQHFHKRLLNFESLNDIYDLLLWGGTVPIAIFAIPAALASYTFFDGGLLHSWFWWLVADGLGVLVVCPLILLWSKQPIASIKRLAPSKQLELVIVLIAIYLTTRFVFTVENPTGAALASYSYLPFPILIWLATRFDVRFTALASLIFAATAIWYDALADIADFNSLRHSLIALEVFLLVVVTVNLLLAALVAERNINSKKLVESLNRFDLALRGGDDGLWDWDLVRDDVYLSSRWKSMLGYTEDGIANTIHAVFRLIHLDDVEEIRRHIKVALANNDNRIEAEFRMQHKDGRWIEILSRGLIERDRSGKPTRLIGTHTDITERKQTEDLLLISEERYKALISSSNTGAWEYFSDTGNFWASTEYFSMLGRNKDDYDLSRNSNLQQTWIELLHPDDQKRASDRFNEYLAKPESMYENNFRMQHADGHWVWVLSRGKTLQDNIGNYTTRTIGTHIDITKQKHTEDQLHRSQKMEALGKLTGGISHDYNNMLNVVLGYAELLKTELAGKPTQADYASEIIHAVERGMKLTNKLLSFSRQTPTDAVSVDINQVLQDSRNMLQRSLTTRINLTIDLAEGLWPVWLDTAELEDVILNLSINAMHAMKHGGNLIFATRNEHIAAGSLQYLELEQGDYVLLTVTDTGTGMNEEIRRRMFDPFFSTKGKEGTGLGLSQVYSFMQSCCGNIKVYSEPGHSTRITLYFPRHDESGSENPAKQKDDLKTLRGDETILIVDDEHAVADLASVVISKYGYRVLKAYDAKQALEVLARESVDLMVSDVIMPKMDGYQLTAKVRELYPHVLIQLSSGYADESHADLVDDDLQQQLLQKPYTPISLLQRLRILLDAGKPLELSKDCTIMVIDDDESVRELYKINLEMIDCTVVLSRNGKEALDQYQLHQQSKNPISAIILDLSIVGDERGTEVLKKIRAINPNAIVIVSSGDSYDPAMINYHEYGFNASLEKTFDREPLKALLKRLILSS